VFLVNSRLGHFSAAPSRLRCIIFTVMGHRFSRSYAVNLPSSLTGVLSRALGFSPRLPVAVCGTGTWFLARGFSWQLGINQFRYLNFALRHASGCSSGGFPYQTPYALGPASISRLAYPSASPHCSNGPRWHGIFNPLSIAYAFRPRLRSRLTLRGRTFLRKP
jgi:hypothetical protein